MTVRNNGRRHTNVSPVSLFHKVLPSFFFTFFVVFFSLKSKLLEIGINDEVGIDGFVAID